MKNKKGMLTLGLLVAAGAAAFAFAGTPEAAPITAPVRREDEKPSSVFPLRRGSSGREVRNVQEALLRIGGIAGKYVADSGGADGKFGPGTELAIKTAGYRTSIDRTLYGKILTDGMAAAKRPRPVEIISKYKGASTSLAPLWKGIQSAGKYGQGYITRLPANTTLGRYLNNQVGDHMLFETTINGKLYRFWAHKDHVKLYSSRVFDEKVATGQILDKTQIKKSSIAQTFAA